MSRTGIGFEDVAGAADALLEAGQSPTIEKVRDYLGKTGSYSTISKYLKDWREAVESPQTAKQVPPDQVQAAVSAVWEKLHHESDSAIKIAKAEAAEKVAEAEGQVALAQEQLSTIQQAFLELQGNYHEQAAQKELLSIEYQELKQADALLEGQLQALSTQHNEMKTTYEVHTKQINHKHLEEIDRIKMYSEKEVLQAKELADQLKSHYEDMRADHMLQLDQVKVENNKLQQKIKTFDLDRLGLLKDLETQASELTQAKEALSQANAMLQKQQTQWDTLKDKKYIANEVIVEINSLPDKLEKLLAEKVNAQLSSQLTSGIDQVIKAFLPKKKIKVKSA